MWVSAAVLLFACAVVTTTKAIRFQPIDWNSYQAPSDKRDAPAADMDPETLRLLTGLYQKMQNDYE